MGKKKVGALDKVDADLYVEERFERCLKYS